ncbi:MAG: hypothetical protein QXK08_04095 [Candidatus Woesearchaeota archaeon]
MAEKTCVRNIMAAVLGFLSAVFGCVVVYELFTGFISRRWPIPAEYAGLASVGSLLLFLPAIWIGLIAILLKE